MKISQGVNKDNSSNNNSRQYVTIKGEEICLNIRVDCEIATIQLQDVYAKRLWLKQPAIEIPAEIT